jgi:hypothetical protein
MGFFRVQGRYARAQRLFYRSLDGCHNIALIFSQKFLEHLVDGRVLDQSGRSSVFISDTACRLLRKPYFLQHARIQHRGMNIIYKNDNRMLRGQLVQFLSGGQSAFLYDIVIEIQSQNPFSGRGNGFFTLIASICH